MTNPTTGKGSFFGICESRSESSGWPVRSDTGGSLAGRYLGLELRNVDSASLVNDLLSLALRYKIRVPKAYAVLTKALITIEGVLRELDPALDALETLLRRMDQ